MIISTPLMYAFPSITVKSTSLPCRVVILNGAPETTSLAKYVPSNTWYSNTSFKFSIFNNVLSEDECNLIIDNKETYLDIAEIKDKCVTSLDFTKWNRFKVWDKTGNGNFGFIDEWHFINVQERLNELLAGNKLRTSTISNIKQTII